MANLIGTKPNQVPTNGSLGTMAFQDSDLVTIKELNAESAEIKLKAIAQTKSETAVDVFVYDTSKDSDGGAWRQRTQGTSWYNETLNTATRGSRKEFPAVAVIVAEAGKVTIYDGDDPSMPMWMVFQGVGLQSSSTYPAKAITAFNGIIVKASTLYGYARANFIADTHDRYRNAGANRRNNGGIVDRNTDKGFITLNDEDRIVSNNANDVAMTVLPDAPIDPATGLPIPTIAVATDGGVSVIKDDGTVVDITSTNVSYTNHVSFDASNKVVFGMGDYKGCNIIDIPDQDYSIGSHGGSNAPEYYVPSAVYLSWGGEDLVYLGSSTSQYKFANDHIGSNKGLTALDRYLPSPSEGMTSFITSEYNTGWMNGDIKLATLSDTDDTDLVGSELVDEASDLYSQITTGEFTIGVGSASVTGLSMNDRLFIAPDGGFIPQGKYVVTFDVLVTDTGFNGLYYNGTYYVHFPSVGSYSTTIDFDGSSNPFFFVSAGDTISIDNISVRLAEPDRSVNNNGLQVFGTVQKSPVATGADLVGYNASTSGTGGMLIQPYNSDLDFGTGDFCVSAWVKDTGIGSTQYLMGRLNDAGTENMFSMWRVTSTGSRQIGFWVGGANTYTTNALPVNVWSHVTFTRKDGVLYVYVDGKLDKSVASTGDVVASTPLVLFARTTGGSSVCRYVSSSLWRISGTAPTAEQIEKIYNDEKVLFQEGAQATLYGTSDAVTALAYDDTTELLHVGTSSGRSVFQGLKRVDNTTDAVGTAISASNNLVVEE